MQLLIDELGWRDYGGKHYENIFTRFFHAYYLPEKFGYIINRLITFFDPNQGDKFQSSSALDAIKLGGVTGQGMGEGILKESVPEAHTDYVIAIISEEYGSIVSVMIISIFLYISFRIIKNCFNQDDFFVKMITCYSLNRLSMKRLFFVPILLMALTKCTKEQILLHQKELQ